MNKTDAAISSWLEEVQARADEPLHPDLVPYVEESDFLGLCLKHPLVYDIPHFAHMRWRCNDQYAYKRAALEEAMRNHDWNSVIWLHERPYRRDALWTIRRKLTDREYWDLVGMVWTDSDNIWQWGNLTRQLMGSQRPGRQYIMDEEERAALAAMPDTLTIYRGLTSRGTRKGWSWTLDRAKAGWFAKRLAQEGDEPIVLTGTVSKAHVIAYFTGRGEEEIVVNPRDVKGGML
jgi:hypothetical protein